MRFHRCHLCRTDVPAPEAVLRGDGHRLLAWHRGCFPGTLATPPAPRAGCVPAPRTTSPNIRWTVPAAPQV